MKTTSKPIVERFGVWGGVQTRKQFVIYLAKAFVGLQSTVLSVIDKFSFAIYAADKRVNCFVYRKVKILNNV